MWGLYIATFIFWIGMSHSGTLLSAILLLMHADWRKPIYRFAEAMTTFSLMTAGLFVLVHLGRIWQFYYVVAYPSERWAWPNFSSPLVWDATAIGTYLTTSIIFLYFGMIPDLAICRDKAHGFRRTFYRVMSVGWKGTDWQWANFRVTYLTLACLLIPLAVSVHSIVATDFAVSQQPGWHTTSFPPYFRRRCAVFRLRRDHHAVHHPALYVPLRAVHDDSHSGEARQADLRHFHGMDVPESDRVRLGLVRHRRSMRSRP